MITTTQEQVKTKTKNIFSLPVAGELEQHHIVALKTAKLLGATDESLYFALQTSCKDTFLKRLHWILSFRNIDNKSKLLAINKLIDNMPKDPKKIKSKVSKKRYKPVRLGTINRLLVLSALYSTVQSLKQLQAATRLSERRIADSLKAFQKVGYVTRLRESHHYIYSLTNSGSIFLYEQTSKTLPVCVIRKIFNNTHTDNVLLVALLLKAKLANKKLLEHGYYWTTARETLKKHKTSYVLNVLEYVENRKDIINKGGYSYTILYNRVNDNTRKAAITTKLLVDKLDKSLLDIAKEELEVMTVKQTLRYALALRKVLRKKPFPLRVQDLRAIAGYILKQ